MAPSSKTGKHRYWVSVGYLENMRDDWRDVIEDVYQLPGCYCVHDEDKDSDGKLRKEHGHFILVFPNTTTYNHALNTFRLLDKSEDSTAFNTCEPVLGMRNKYNYLIHDTKTCREQGKHLYEPSKRVEFNNFDIGMYEKLSRTEKGEIIKRMSLFIRENRIQNLDQFENAYDPFSDAGELEVYMTHNAYFYRLCSGVHFTELYRSAQSK